MISSGATGVDTQAWDYLSHYYDLSAFLPQNVVLVNKAAFEALPAEVRTGSPPQPAPPRSAAGRSPRR